MVVLLTVSPYLTVYYTTGMANLKTSVSYILEIHYIKFTKCFFAKCG